MFKISLKRNVSRYSNIEIYLIKIGEIIPTKVIQASISGFSSLRVSSYNKTKSRKMISCEKCFRKKNKRNNFLL